MLDAPQNFKDRRATLESYVQRRLKRGFQIVSRSDTTAELHKPAKFPAFLRREQTIYVDVDEQGRLFIHKSEY